MNTFMWDHPFTAQHLAALRAFPYMTVVDPVSKVLACGDNGKELNGSGREVVGVREHAP